MSSTLHAEEIRVPEDLKTWYFTCPVKNMISKRYFGHDGSCYNGEMLIDEECLIFLEGIAVALTEKHEKSDRKELEQIIRFVKKGGIIKLHMGE